MAVVGAEAFAVGGKPGADYLVFGAGKEYVAVFGISKATSQRCLSKMTILFVRGIGLLDLSQGPLL